MLISNIMPVLERTCPRCGLTFVSEKLDGLCPSCLLSHTFDAEDPDEGPAFWEDVPEPKKTRLRAFSHFEFLDELGRGGMGVVYRARDLNTERIVALKVLQAHHLDVPDLVQRFRSEVRAVSSLDHPNILPIHEVGEYDGIPFFSMKLTTGGSLAHSLGNYLGRPREAAQLLAKVARGVQHAHERGILHRDLKPGNILLDAAGEPYVCDFGLAKWLEDDRNLTITAAVLGTPHYIAPEQALGSKALTTAVDIYSLGAILYELLTGRPPFVGASVLETLVASQEQTPDRPSSLARNVPADLETICLKALQHEPGARYATAGAFAEDLENWLAGRPINARPVSAAEQLWRWAKRNPLPAILVATLIVASIVAAIAATTAALHIQKSRNRALFAEAEALRERANAEEKLYDALRAQARAARLTGTSGQRFDALDAIARAAKIHPSAELRDEAVASLTLYDIRIKDRWQIRENPAKQPLIFDRLLSKVYVGTETGTVRIYDVATKSLLGEMTDYSPVHALCHSGSRFLAVRHGDNRIMIWDCASLSVVHEFRKYPMTSRDARYEFDFVFSADEENFALSRTDGSVEIYNTLSWELQQTLPTSLQINVLQFSNSGHSLAVADGVEPILQIWSIQHPEAGPKSIKLASVCHSLAWDPRDLTIAAGCQNFWIYFIDPSTLTISEPLRGHNQEVIQAIYNPSGDILATTSRDFTIRLWDVRTKTEQVHAESLGGEPALRFSPDGKFLSATDFNINAIIMEVAGNERILNQNRSFFPQDYATLVSSVAFSPDEKILAVSSFSSVSLVNTSNANRVSAFDLVSPGKTTERTIRFVSPTMLLVASNDHPVRVFDVTDPSSPKEIAKSYELQTIPNGILGATTNGRIGSLTRREAGEVILFNPHSLKILRKIENLDQAWDALAGPNEAWIAVGFGGSGPDHTRIIVPHGSRDIESGSFSILAANPDFSILLTSGSHGLREWRTDTWEMVEPPYIQLDPMSVATAAFSPDGKTVAFGVGEDIVLASTESRHVLCTLSARLLSSQKYRLAFSPSGQLLAAQGGDNSLRIWNLTLLHQDLETLHLDWK